MVKACIFGASGGIGAALVEALLENAQVSQVFALSRTPPESSGKLTGLHCDIADAASVAGAVGAMAAQGMPDMVLVASGILHFPDGAGPERSLRAIDPKRMADMFALNTIAPAIIAQHVLPRLSRKGRSVFAVLSARVGSIRDNRLGGWHSYRASKAALNMLVRNFAIEMRRTHPEHICVALHPGTVDTPLSEPFQANVPAGQLHSPAVAAGNLLRVLDGLAPKDSGEFFAWDGQPIAF